MRTPVLILALIGIVALSAIVLLANRTSTTDERKIGGGCTYADYPGTCPVTGVKANKASSQQGTEAAGPGYPGYVITFTYDAKEGADGGEAGAGEHRLTLMNGWYPGPKFVSKYAIAEGKTFACSLKVRTSGACTPTVFEFPTIDRTDYFETAR